MFPDGISHSKRIFDLLFTSIGLVIISPVLAIIASLVRITHGKPILFHQIRPGYLAKPFCNLKFRTMLDTHDANGNLLPDDERITPLGHFLRVTSLDELPELLNVIRGEMSLVGPRPLLMEYLDRYTTEQARRHEVLPGITGWAQVNGRNILTWEDKFQYDVWYVVNRSMGLDINILWMTFWKVLKREGISQPGYATAEKFMGSEEQPDK